MKKALLFFFLVFAIAAQADVLGEYSFEGTLGDKIPVRLKFAVERPAVLGEGTHDYFYYENVNECGYGFSAHFFKKFVVLKSTTKYETFGCFGMGVAFDGVYIKVKQ